MRVIAGEAHGRRLRAGKGRAIRPTGAKVKAAIFNILASRFAIDGAGILDLFAGSGGLGIEALSRGASTVTFVERDPASWRVLRANILACGMAERARILRLSVTAALRLLSEDRARFDGVLLDPPYDKGWIERTLPALAAADLVRPGGWVVVEHSANEIVAAAYGRLVLTQDRRYGKTALAILVADAEISHAKDP